MVLNCSFSSVSDAVVVGIFGVEGMEKEVVEKEVAVGVEKEVAVGVAVGKEVGMGKDVEEIECVEKSSVISLRIVATPCCAMVCICFKSCKCSAYDIVSPSSGSAVVQAPGLVEFVVVCPNSGSAVVQAPELVTSCMVCDFCIINPIIIQCVIQCVPMCTKCVQNSQKENCCSWSR